MDFNDEIVSIEYCGEEPTIDIQVSNNNLFYANKILTHNCGYDETPDMKFAAGGTGNNVTADLLVGISRTDEDVEMGLIRFNIMKNRNGPANISKCMKIDMDTLDITEDDTLDQIEEHKETYSMFEDLSES